MNDESFITFKIKLKTAADFRIFCRQLGKQQSECLQLMLDFFKNNGLSPFDDLGPNLISLEKKIKTRINAVVAILRDIEKTQTKPSHAMLQLLFSENLVKKKDLLLEKNQGSLHSPPDQHKEIIAYKIKEAELRRALSKRTDDLKLILDKVIVVRNNFGKAYLRLNLSPEEYEFLKSKF